MRSRLDWIAAANLRLATDRAGLAFDAHIPILGISHRHRRDREFCSRGDRWMYDESDPIFPSLTALAVQVRWKVPTEFPACPDEFTDDALLLYASRLDFGGVFARNQFSTSLVVDSRLKDDDLVVLTRFARSGPKDWAVAHVALREGTFAHRSEATFLTLQGALKRFCELLGEDIADSIDDYC